jgi:glycosyltransferase involved in cell wall biosynthesis
MNSLVSQIDDEFEVIIVDSLSTDGTYKILHSYEKDPRVKILQKKCNRGIGRETALENSKGRYVISNLDLDDIYLPRLREMIAFYHARSEGKVVLVNENYGVTTQNVTIAPKEVLEQLGGWRDLQWSEDWDLWCRAAKAEKYSWTVFKLVDKVNTHVERRKASRRTRVRFNLYRDMLRVGRRPFSKAEHASLGQRLPFILALLSWRFFSSYRDEFNKRFGPYDSKYFVQWVV